MPQALAAFPDWQPWSLCQLLSFLDPGYNIPSITALQVSLPWVQRTPFTGQGQLGSKGRKTWQTYYIYLYNRKTCWSWAQKFLWAAHLFFLPSLLLSFLDPRKGLQLCDSRHSLTLGIVLNRLRQSCSVRQPAFPHYCLVVYPSVIAWLRHPNELAISAFIPWALCLSVIKWALSLFF